jgi:hypothetical protein
MPHSSHSSLFHHPNNVWWAVQKILALTNWKGRDSMGANASEAYGHVLSERQQMQVCS